MPALAPERPAARLGERPRHDGAHPPARPRRARARLDRATSRPTEQLELDREYRTLRVRRRALPRGRPRLRAPRGHASRRPTDRPALCWGDSRIGNMIFGDDQRGRRGPRLGDGHGRRPGAGPRLVPAARPPPRDGLRRRPPARAPAARGVDRPVGGGQRALRRAPRVVRAARRRPLRVDHGPRDEAARQHAASSPAPPRAPSTRPAPACSSRCSTSAT